MLQIATSTDGITYLYLSKITYPNKNYYENRIESRKGKAGFLYLPTARNSSEIMFGNIKGDDLIPTVASLVMEYGG